MDNLLTTFLLLASMSTFAQQSIVFPQAKFQTGDNLEWKNTSFDDSKWASIKTTGRWEKQGYDRYDGFAWYRIKFVLPSSLKANAYWKDSLSFLLSRIDDADETFVNGVLIGKTGSFATDPGGEVGRWDINRVYNIPSNSNFINWDKENVIAVRVSDFSGGGGMFGDVPSVKILEPQDVTTLTLTQVDNYKYGMYTATLINTSAKIIEGTMTVIVLDEANNKTIKTMLKPIILHGLEQVNETAIFQKNIRYKVTASFKEKHTNVVKSVKAITPYILTPVPSAMPRINSATVFGARPNSPFLFKVAATGSKPLQYNAIGLPEGLVLNKNTGVITGKIGSKADYKIELKVENSLGKATQKFIIKVGEQLALTPPMGWNSWNCWGLNVSDEKVKSSAQALIDKDLINHGWNYMNIDDGWEATSRDKNGSIIANNKFPDMYALGDWLHKKGLKFGIYSSPGTKTCGGYLGSYQHELQDADTYGKWGIDYLKYDWCTYEDIFYNDHDTSLAAYQKPYKIMQAALQQQPRDILYSLCQYGMKDVWKWGADVNGNSWRTTDDIKDTWESVKSIGFSQAKLYPYASPGHWNDIDIFVVGQVGWSGKLRPTTLTPDEQYAHVSLWCLLSAPLLIGCDIRTIDDFTLNLLTNDEVIAVNQDALGKQAEQKIKTSNYEVWVKELADGSKAIGIFNMAETFQNITLDFNEIGLKGMYNIRDLWRQKNLGSKQNHTSKLPPHGVVFIKLRK